jgi:predicted metal-dependent phosphoesterase TrpH
MYSRKGKKKKAQVKGLIDFYLENSQAIFREAILAAASHARRRQQPYLWAHVAGIRGRSSTACSPSRIVSTPSAASPQRQGHVRFSPSTAANVWTPSRS